MFCYDCHGHNDEYMVHREVWATAWADYPTQKKELRNRHKRGEIREYETFLLLCLKCLATRLKRSLHPSDFDFSIPINKPILIGYMMGKGECDNGLGKSM